MSKKRTEPKNLGRSGIEKVRKREYHKHNRNLRSHFDPGFYDRFSSSFVSDSAVSPLLQQEVKDLNADLRIFKLEDSSRSFFQRFFKRWLDVIGALAGLLLLSPVFLTVWIAIKTTSRGPTIFVQDRIGKGGKVFKILKFRTMVHDAEQLKKNLMKHNQMTGAAFKMKNDPRVTPVGAFLRKYSLDELPQLVNILKGDMSLVGPRPAIIDEAYSWKLWQTRRLSVDQGLTCIWQVSGRSDIKFDSWMEMDLDYIDNWSLKLDIKLIIKTVYVVFKGKGAY